VIHDPAWGRRAGGGRERHKGARFRTLRQFLKGSVRGLKRGIFGKNEGHSTMKSMKNCRINMELRKEMHEQGIDEAWVP
jgi:hypothetical protein